MGMSASQARLLMLTARKSDLEYQAQQICQAKLALARETEEVAVKYNNAISNTCLTFQGVDKNGSAFFGKNLDFKTLMNSYIGGIESDWSGKGPAGGQGRKYAVIYKGQRITMDDANGHHYLDYTNPDGSIADDTHYNADKNSAAIKAIMNASPEEFQNMILSGYIEIQEWDPNANNGDGAYVPISTSSGVDFDEGYDKSDDARAEAEYNLETKKIQTKEKQLDMNLKQIETQHTAVTNEMESVEKIVKDNVEKTFKTFA